MKADTAMGRAVALLSRRTPALRRPIAVPRDGWRRWIALLGRDVTVQEPQERSERLAPTGRADSLLPAAALYPLFSLMTVAVTTLLILENPFFGVLPLGPVLLVWLTYRHGFDRVPESLVNVVVLQMTVPAFFVGKTTAGNQAAAVLTAASLFLLWAVMLPVLLRHLDKKHALTPISEYRLLTFRLSLTIAMVLVSGDTTPALICLAALLFRRKWLAALAVLGCLALPLLYVGYAEVRWEILVLAILAGLLSAYQWFSAIGSPYWGFVRSLPRFKVTGVGHYRDSH